jgi:hypothetical protein
MTAMPLSSSRPKRAETAYLIDLGAAVASDAVSRVCPRAFVAGHPGLSPLSRREALRHFGG